MELVENNPLRKKIKNENQFLINVKELNEFRKIGLFCNFTIFLPDQSSFKVHKNVMAAGCRYFKALFNSDKKQESATIQKDVPGEIFEKIIEFIYTGETEIDLKDALVLHENAVFFLLDTLKNDICTQFLIDNIDMDTCLIYWRGAVCDNKLRKKCDKFIEENAKEFLDKFLNDLSNVELNNILSLEKLICPEEELYSFVMKWVNIDYEMRQDKLDELLNNLRYCSINDTVKVKLMVECCELDNSLKVLAKHFKKSVEQSNNLADKTLVPRIGSRIKNIYGISKTKIAKFDKANWTFANLLDIKKPDGFKVANFKANYLLISGGENSTICEYFCPIRNFVKPFPEMIEGRSKHGVVTLKDFIYAAGGCENGKTTEKFDLGSEIWLKGPDLNNARRDYDLTSWNNNCIYAFGGGSNIIERLDYRENKWIPLDLPTNYDLNGCTRSLTIDDSIYCISTENIHIFDIRQNKLMDTFKNNLGSTLSKFEIIYFNKNMYMIGYDRGYSYYRLFTCDMKMKNWVNKKNNYADYNLAVLY